MRNTTLKFDIDASPKLIPLVCDKINAGADASLAQNLSFSLIIHHTVTQLEIKAITDFVCAEFLTI